MGFWIPVVSASLGSAAGFGVGFVAGTRSANRRRQDEKNGAATRFKMDGRLQEADMSGVTIASSTKDMGTESNNDFDAEVLSRAAVRLTAQEIGQLRTSFLGEVNGLGRDDQGHQDSVGLSREEFLHFLGELAGHGSSSSGLLSSLATTAGDGNNVDREVARDFIFELFDTNKDGTVCLREFICGLSVLCRGSREDRLRYLFYMYDDDRSGYLSHDEIARVIAIMRTSCRVLGGMPSFASTKLTGDIDIMDDEWDEEALVESVMEKADTDGDGSIDFSDFESWAKENSVVTHWCDWIGNVCGDGIAGLREQKERELRLLELARMGLVPDEGATFSLPEDGLTASGGVGELTGSANLPAVTTFEIDYATIALKEEIGSGAFASVFKGEWLQIPVAVKVLHECDAATKAQMRDELQKEVSVLTSLRHPNVVLYMGLCLDVDSPLCLVTELFPGGSLTGFLRSNGRPATPLALKIAIGIARGMIYLHSMKPKVYHRDLKSANVLVGDNDVGRVVICDFGLSQVSAHADTSHHPSKGSQEDEAPEAEPTGTPNTMAPEIINGERYRSASDVYSFGIILWEIIAGRCDPYGKMNPIQIMYHVVSGGRPELEAADRKDTPKALIELMEDCWAEDPAARPKFVEVASRIASLM